MPDLRDTNTASRAFSKCYKILFQGFSIWSFWIIEPPIGNKIVWIWVYFGIKLYVLDSHRHRYTGWDNPVSKLHWGVNDTWQTTRDSIRQPDTFLDAPMEIW